MLVKYQISVHCVMRSPPAREYLSSQRGDIQDCTNPPTMGEEGGFVWVLKYDQLVKLQRVINKVIFHKRLP